MAATSVLMMTTHSFFNAALSRLPSPEIYLAAFAVAKSVMHIFESPIMMVRQTVSTLVYNRQSYSKVKKFFIIVTLLTVGIMSLVAFTDMSEWLFSQIMGVEGRVLEEAIIIFSVFAFFPAAAALRNFMQGIAVKLDRTPLFTVATFFRLIYVFILIFLVDKLVFLPGSIFAGLMFFTAVGLEGIVIFTGVKITEKDISGKIKEKTGGEKAITHKQKKLTHRYIFRFFWPLIITSIIHMGVAPLVNMGLARTVSPEIAISAYTVAWNLGILIISPSFMYHQQIINFFDKSPAKTAALKKFGFYIGIIMFLILALLAFTKAGFFVMCNWIGVSELIAELARDVLRLMVFMPPIVMAREFYWGILMKENKTGFVSRGKTINLFSLIVVIIVLLIIMPSNPAIIGALAVIVAESMEALYLFYVVHSRKIVSGSLDI